MTKLFGMWLTIFYVMFVVGCTPTTDEPSLSAPTQTAEALPVSTPILSPTPNLKSLPTVSNLQEGTPTPTKTPVPTSPQFVTETPPTGETTTQNEVIVIAGDSETYQIKVGQIFTFQGPRGPGWQIGYDQSMLTLLTTEAESQQPGDTWELQAKQETGRTRIWLTNIPPPCDGEFCPPVSGAAIEMEAFVEIINE